MWTVSSPRDPDLKYFKECSCEDGTIAIKKIIDEVIQWVSTISKIERTKDFKKYGLYPGQQICYGNVIPFIKSTTHCAIYLHDGLILEAGSAPEKCIKDIGQFNTYFGLSTLEQYKRFAKNKRKSKVSKIITKKDSKKNEIIKRLGRTKKIIGFHNFSVISSNCVQMTNYVTFGEYRWSYPNGVITEIIN